jgi:hypothetical protein
MSTFDTANPNACTARRQETTIPQQTLFALNSDFIQDRAARLAALTKDMNLASDDERITMMVRKTLGRNPSDAEIAHARTFLTEATANMTTPEGGLTNAERGWVLLAHALLASNEFTFLD